jgi:hypothetical protein
LLKEKYADFGATLASEKLLELDGIKVSVEMVRRIQIGLRLWRPKPRRARRVFQLRERRPRFGELIQIDCLPLRRRGAARTTGLKAARRVAR